MLAEKRSEGKIDPTGSEGAWGDSDKSYAIKKIASYIQLCNINTVVIKLQQSTSLRSAVAAPPLSCERTYPVP